MQSEDARQRELVPTQLPGQRREPCERGALINRRTVVITGSTGQVGSAVATLLRSHHDVHTPDRNQLNLADADSIRSYLRSIRPAWIINPAAYTAVDQAEADQETAFSINAEAPRVIGEEASLLGARVLHFSTDYVFDGTSDRPYIESDQPNPVSVYGASKLAGERALAATGASHLILRTSWVYGATGKNFLLTVLRLAREQRTLRIVADQHGTPTASQDLAALVEHIVSRDHVPLPAGGVYHATGAGDTTWFGFAQEIMRRLQSVDPACVLPQVEPIRTDEFPTAAKRPANSRLDCGKLLAQFGWTMPRWQDSVAAVLGQLAPAGLTRR